MKFFLYALASTCVLLSWVILISKASESPSNVVNEKIILSFAGDCTIGDYNPKLNNSFSKKYLEVNNPKYFFEKVRDVFINDDFTFINLEGPLTNQVTKAIKTFVFKGKPQYVAVLVEGGVDGVSLANNHSMDYGTKGLKETMSVLNDNNIVYTYNDICFVKKIKGVKIGYIGYTGWSNSISLQQQIIRQVYEMRAQGAKFIVANFHWGKEITYTPNFTQVSIAHFAIDNGVDLVIGHHPHVMQGKEIYKGKTIVYSLGNFCFGGSRKPYDDETIIYQHIINVDATNHNIIEETSNIVPVKTSSVPGINNYQPTVATGIDADVIWARFEDLSNRLK
ncbi:MAG TPA: capsular biosynthesis protein [Clostridiales bacterium]|nr:MAG: hypothetical protein A2Y22_09440 [Clostridiales bacterium GWD2_32_59]HAN10119.1 capsular biosynthesis protein [Clostridiales bacterium]